MGWTRLTKAERVDLVDRLGRLHRPSSDRAHVANDLGPLPKAIERSLWEALAVRDPEAPIVTDRKGVPEPDPELRDNENVPVPGPVECYDEDPTERLASRPYREAVETYLSAEVLPYVADAWVDHSKTRFGYEIPLTLQFYRFVPPRPLEEIDAEIKALEEEIERLLRTVTA